MRPPFFHIALLHIAFASRSCQALICLLVSPDRRRELFLFLATEETDLGETGEHVFGAFKIAKRQIQFALVFKRALVLGVDGKGFVISRLRDGL